MLVADLTFRLIPTPINRWCSSGHLAAETFVRTLSDHGSEQPIRFFQVIGKEIEGCYCEPCIIVATWQAQRQRKARP